VKRALIIAACAALCAAGCDSEETPVYDAEVVRTTYGIPHVSAQDFGSLGYGLGYAYAQDNFCVLMREVVRSNGETLRWFGEGEGNLADDVVYRWINTDEAIEDEFFPQASVELRDLVAGYAAGVNRYLEETGVDNLAEGPEGCRGEAWVRPITDVDLGKVYRKLIVRASTGQLTDPILAAEAPEETMALRMPSEANESTVFDLDRLGFPPPEAMGSNAYGIGADASQTGRGILLGNPHFPWSGSLRWYVSHLTVEGEYDVMGASLQGVPLINIGFNQDLAWSHTVSTGRRFTLYEVQLSDTDPMVYLYDGEERPIESERVTIEVLQADGSVVEVTETVYTTQYGPVVDLTALNAIVGGWPTATNTVFTLRDANLNNGRAFDQFLALGRARSIDDVEEALRIIGLPWVNTIAADRNGDAFYADVTVVPNVTAAQLDDCGGLTLSTLLNGSGIPTLDGSRSACEWGTDADAPEAGLLGYENLPRLRNRTYVGNSNDSYWLSNPSSLLTGFSPLIGQEDIEQTLRTRLAFVQAEERIAGTDDLEGTGFTVELLQEVMFGNRDLSEELIRDDVLALCDGTEDWSAVDCDGGPYSANPVEAATVCDILRDWDGRYEVDSVGGAVWNEFWGRIRGTRGLWATPFDAADPVNTPRDLDVESETIATTVRCALGAIVDTFVARGVPLDRPWGEWQYRVVGEERVPIHGGSGAATFSVISSRYDAEENAFSNIPTGNSYIQTVTWDETDCPDAFAVLTYSQSTDPASPHYADMTRLYSMEGWNDMPFCPEDVTAEAIGEPLRLTNAPAP
jgi:acyl-homoserine-lactone acylase